MNNKPYVLCQECRLEQGDYKLERVTKNTHTDGRILETMLLISEQMETTLYYNYYLGKAQSCVTPNFQCNYNKAGSAFCVK